MTTYHRMAEVDLDFDGVVETLRSCGPLVVGAVDDQGRPFHADMAAHVFGIEISHPVTVACGEVEQAGDPFHIATLSLEIHASDREEWFPVFDGDLEVVGLASGSVEVAMEGTYRSPGGAVGALSSAVGLHRIAEESLDHYFQGVVDRLRDRCRSASDDVGGAPV